MSALRDGAISLEINNIREYIDRTARNVVQYMIDERLTVSTAESCTGGIIGAALTSVPGASKIYGCGVISYSEKIKEKLLEVPHKTIEVKGVVSAETAISMAEGVMKLSGSDVSVAVTGLAGPASDEDGLPVGTVYIAVIYKDIKFAENLRLYELGNFDRETNRLLSAAFALEKTFEIIKRRR